MTRFFAIAAAAALLAFTLPAEARGRSSGSHAHYSNQGGHYAGGKGSSHKGGAYKNARTNNHYTSHKK
ncbi:hypothetical protein GCM10027296_12270 [Chitinimonas naiadis]